SFLKAEMEVSKDYQRSLMEDGSTMHVKGFPSYPIHFEKDSLGNVSKIFEIPDNASVVIVSDTGVPKIHKDALKKGFLNALSYEFEQGESNKNISVLQGILAFLAENSIPRDSYLITLGGGVVGDMGGFAASIYNRGIKWINIPTTLLSQVDSSIGGKTAIDFGGYKNIVGAFYNPIGVLIDVDTLKTLDQRQVKAGLAEAIKMAATFDEEFFRYFETTSFDDLDFEKVVRKALSLKRYVVEKDPKEAHLRKTLNFGHTIGHGLESTSGGALLHGEAISLGMLLITQGEVKNRLRGLLSSYKMPTQYRFDRQAVLDAIKRDKKKNKNGVSVVLCEKIGTFTIKDVPFEEIETWIKEGKV
ncbi:MAG: 3-dehydroquinate synthase, partial [Bacilli bacterium]|nr:3-dehydroquinate synthase [Bacilli bacterium]